MASDIFLQHLVNGISLGSLYALVAIGYTMVYGILRMINFAHGDIFMMAAYFAFFGIVTFKVPWYISVVSGDCSYSSFGHFHRAPCVQDPP